ncbi:MAG: TPM domain-containing protein [Pelobium sp.]
MSHYKKHFLLLLLSIISVSTFAQNAYKLEDIPDPKNSGQDYFVSNPDGVLTNVQTLNALIVDIEKTTKIEIAVVVVKDFDADAEDFQFALDLFRKWGIGKKGADNGLLLFVATDRHKYRFITGYGLEGMLTDLKLKRIGETYLVPAFKKQAYDDGVMEALGAIESELLNPSNESEIQGFASKIETKVTKFVSAPFIAVIAILVIFFIGFKRLANSIPKDIKLAFDGKNPVSKSTQKGCLTTVTVMFFIIVISFITGILKNLHFIHYALILFVLLSIALYFTYLYALGSIKEIHPDDENFLIAEKAFNRKVWWLAILSPFVLYKFILNPNKRSKLFGERFVPPLDSKKQVMTRVNRDENVAGKPFLSKGQLAEELAFVYDYDIWVSKETKENLIKKWPAEYFDNFSECPECKFKTLSAPYLNTIVSATTSREGSAEKVKTCKNCNFKELIEMVVLSKISKSSSSSGSSSGGSSSSSSSSSGGSWGGGSSGGGGSGGSW